MRYSSPFKPMELTVNVCRLSRLLAGMFFFAWLGCISAVKGVEKPAHEQLPNFDKRVPQARDGKPHELAPERGRAADKLRGRVPNVRVELDEVTGSPRFIASPGGFLSGPRGQGRGISREQAQRIPAGDPHRAIKAFLNEHSALFAHGAETLAPARLQRETIDKNGLRSSVWQQEVDGIDVYEGVVIGHVTADEELVSVSSQFVPDAGQAANNGTPNRAVLQAAPTVDAVQAVILAAGNLEEEITREEVSDSGGDEPSSFQFKAGRLPGEATAKLVWLPLSRTSLRLCWQVEITRRLGGERFRLLIDAATGEVLLRRQLTVYLANATYNVFTSDSPSPLSPGHSTPSTNQPPLVSRSLVTLSALNTNASPVGWIHDGENETRGNNVDAHLDRNADDSPDLPRPRGNPFRVFDFPMDPTQAPATYGDAAAVQLFYWCNWMHDKLYELGFTEAAGNFQKDNFGRGGLGGDAILADAQDGSGFNNANFTPTADGQPGRIQMYVFTGPEPDRDGDFDAEIVLHEYTHGLSDRLVGGGVGISALQTGGMGEGWSDFYAEAMLSEPSDDLNGAYPMGGYATHRFFGLLENYYFGIRRYPYSIDLSKNPLTFKDIDPDQVQPHFGVARSPLHPFNPNFANEVHYAGEVWCVTLWEARANLIRKHGFHAGDQLILQLVTDGMKLSPPNPSFLEARDAIILADQVNTGGANWAELWAAFAKRGMGFSAFSPAASTTTGIREAFDLPDPLVVSPSRAFITHGPVGGPLEPACAVYTLTNHSDAPLPWSVQIESLETGTPWLTVTPSSGTLPVGGGIDVTVCVNQQVQGFGVGTFSASITFSNGNTGIGQVRDAQARITRFASMPFYDGFEESDQLAEHWLATGTADHRIQVTSSHGPRSGGHHAVMDTTGTGNFSRNELTLAVDLGGYTNVVLSFWARQFGEEDDGPAPVPFINGADFDGVAISADGVRWYEVLSLRGLPPSYSNRVVNLDDAVALHGLAYNSQFRIRFNQYDNNSVPFDGIGIDDVSLEGVPARRFRITVPAQATEGDGVLSGAGRVELFAAAQQAISLQLTSSDTTKLTVPSTVVIPAGATEAVFAVTVLDNSLLDGTQPVTISGSATGFVGEAGVIAVHDNESANLRVSAPGRATEGDGLLRRMGNIRASARVARDVPVRLSSSDANEIAVPATVMLLAGESSVGFDITVVDDSRLDGATNVTITASVDNWTAASTSIEVRDNDTFAVGVMLPEQVNEGEGTLARAGQVTLGATLATNLVVSLVSSDESEVRVPASVVILAGRNNAAFDLTIMDDTDIDGPQSASVLATTPFGGASAAIRVVDDETPPAPYGPTPVNGQRNVLLDADLRWQGGSGEIVINGGFENGNFSGWRIDNSGFGTFFINDGTFDPEGPDNPLPPFAGRYSAITEQIGSGRHVIYQDLFIPPEARTATLTWADRIRNHAREFNDPTQEFRVEIRDLSNNLLALAFSTKPGDMLLNDWKQRSFDLTAFRGRDIRLAFVEEDSIGYFNVHLDDISVMLGAAAPTTFDVYFGTNSTPGPAEYRGTTSNGFWELEPLELAQTYFWQIVSRRGAATTTGPIWHFTTRGVGSVHHFDWSPIEPVQYANQPFPVTVTARDDLNNVVTSFDDEVAIRALPGSPVASAVVISEIDTGNNDAVEFFNVSGHPVNISGWQISLYDRRAWPAPVATFTIPTNTTVHTGGLFTLTAFGTAPGQYPNFIAGTNLFWSFAPVSNQVAVLLRDAQGRIVDFVCASEANASQISLPTPIPADEWMGSAIAVNTNIAFSYQRTGFVDHNDQSDWVGTNATMGGLNLNMSATFSNRVPVSFAPTMLANFVGGQWTGQFTVHEPVANLTLLADDTRDHIGFSNPFSVGVSNDVSLTVTDTPDVVLLGDDLTYTIIVSNAGPANATDIIVTDPLPGGLSYVSASTSAGACGNVSGIIFCVIDTLEAGGTARIDIVATTLSAGIITNTATISRAEPDPYLPNNTVSAVSTINGPRIAIGPAAGFVSVTEGNTGTREALLPVQLSARCRLPVSVNYTTFDVSARSGEDYLAATGTLVFAPNTLEQMIPVTILADTIYEGAELVFVNLSSPTNGALLNTIGRVRILEDDPVPQLSVDDLVVRESAPGTMTNALFNVRLSAPSGLPTTIGYTTSNRTALAGLDYVRQSGSLTFEPGVTNRSIIVAVNGDSVFESNEVFVLNVTNVLNALLLKPQGACTITDNGFTELEHFEWSAVPSPQYANVPFAVTLTARDGRNNLVPDFAGAVSLRAVVRAEERQAGTGRGTWENPLGTFYHDSRTQLIYPAAELGGAGTINGIALEVATPPAQTLSNWTIRLKHTTMDRYLRPEWENTGWNTVYQRHEIVSQNGWVNFFFDTPFTYNGSNNLLVDLSFDNASYTADGICRVSSNASPRALYFRTDSGFGNPLSWSGTNVPGQLARQVPNMRFLIENTVPLSPSISANFANGVWVGQLTLQSPASNVVLRAVDQNGHSGDTLPFTVESASDNDGDGLPDAWENFHFGSTSAPGGGANQDPDGDGFTNLQEFRAGTNPRDPTSVARITTTEVISTGVRISFTTVRGKAYQLERASNVLGQWIPVGTPVAGDGGTMQTVDSTAGAGSQQFYRVRLLP